MAENTVGMMKFELSVIGKARYRMLLELGNGNTDAVEAAEAVAGRFLGKIQEIIDGPGDGKVIGDVSLEFNKSGKPPMKKSFKDVQKSKVRAIQRLGIVAETEWMDATENL
jgi:hypothetical protein